jgi:hypothetical protein
VDYLSDVSGEDVRRIDPTALSDPMALVAVLGNVLEEDWKVGRGKVGAGAQFDRAGGARGVDLTVRSTPGETEH